jgi:transposase
MWAFRRLDGVPCATNVEECMLGPTLIWGKFGLITQSEAGSAFMARMLTVVMTLRARGRNVLESMTASYQAASKSAKAHALLPQITKPQQDEPLIAA